MSYIIVQISVFIVLLPVLFGVVKYSRISSKQQLLVWMLVAVALNQFISKILIGTKVLDNNMPFFHMYILIEFCFLSILFTRLLNSKKFTQFQWMLGVAFIVFFVIILFQKNGIWTYPTYTHFVESVLVLFYGGSYFYKTFSEGRVVSVVKDFGFWVSTGILLYFSSNCLLFLFSEYVAVLSPGAFQLIWTVHAFLTILLYIAYTIAIQCKTNHNLS